ncbi:DNA/RNA non-specific endonuclease [Rhizobium sp. BK176]|uniref:DNA/RNA non-specific endonuclease n=1 Tax=Rhizobium sp. BK176 TaxID=2587071 RepID=UPI00216A85DA|nr:DNA/RNA non-specific endonuclease [Rhizobium sp. BK176]MCS4088905.1 endonuclease G [Rhizobium sp. BK176]
MKSSFFAAALAATVLFSQGAASEVLPTDCSTDYVGGTAPDLVNAKLKNGLRELCFSEFAVYHSGLTATPLFVAQHLTADIVHRAKAVDRVNVFHAEPRLPSSERAELSHYARSGFDRGHMAAAADMATTKGQDESFSLANMVPQKPSLNRKDWAKIEDTTRDIAERYGEVYVVTGPVFSGASLSRIGGRVLVPTYVYKAVYVPSTGQSSAWWADNKTGGMEVVTIDQLTDRVGADVFPAVPASSKAALVKLPLPLGAPPITVAADTDTDVTAAIPQEQTKAKVNGGGHAAAAKPESWWDWVLAVLVAVLEIVVRIVWRS